MSTGSKRYRANCEKVDRSRRYDLDEAVRLVKQTNTAKFDESVEISMKLGIDPKQSDQMVRGSVVLPKGTGKSVRVIAFAEREQAEKAKAAGAVEAGGEELVDKVSKGWFEFDVAIAAPSMMRHVGKLGRVLGPKGLMPSPKSGTVTEDIEQAVTDFMGGKIEYRADAGANVNVAIGKSSFAEEDLKQNITTFIDHIRAARPAKAKGTFIQRVSLSSSMGPGIPLAI